MLIKLFELLKNRPRNRQFSMEKTIQETIEDCSLSEIFSDVEEVLGNSSGTSSGTSRKSSSKDKSSERKKLIELDGEIGYTKSGNIFVAMTNFAVKCTGYVTTEIDSTNAEGYRLDVYPKSSVSSSESEQSDATSTAETR